MVTITYASLQTLVKDTTITAATCEAIIDHAIDKINGYGADLPNMGGTSGSKTLTVESRVAGFVMSVAVAIYQKDYKSSGAQSSSYGIGSLSKSQSASTGSGSEIEELAKAAGAYLKEPDIITG
jgi:hypothetical protein